MPSSLTAGSDPRHWQQNRLALGKVHSLEEQKVASSCTPDLGNQGWVHLMLALRRVRSLGGQHVCQQLQSHITNDPGI